MASKQALSKYKHRVVLKMTALQGGKPNQEKVIDLDSNNPHLSLWELASLEKEQSDFEYEAKVFVVSTFTQ